MPDLKKRKSSGHTSSIFDDGEAMRDIVTDAIRSAAKDAVEENDRLDSDAGNARWKAR